MDTSENCFACNDRIMLGEGLFETIKVRQGRPCFSKLHWQRMHDAAQHLAIPFTVSLDEWHHLLLHHLLTEQKQEGGIKVILSGGPASRGLVVSALHSKLVLNSFNYPRQEKPLRLQSAAWLRDAANPVYSYKTINYLEAILARRQALNNNADDALFFNTQQHATETTCANLFIIVQGRLITPPLHDGVLPGITRSRILQHCTRLSIDYAEQSITYELLRQAQAVFLANSLQGIQSVISIDAMPYKTTHPLITDLIEFLAQEELKQHHLQ